MSETTISRPPLTITPNNHGGYVLITAALLMVWSLLFFFIRLTVRFGCNNYFASDDTAATIATVFGFVQSILIMLAVSKGGLGKHIDKLDATTLKRTELYTYSADILFIVAICFAKISTSELVARLTHQIPHLVACRLLSIATAVWGLASVLAISIGCHLTHPWDMVDRCSDLSTSWIAIGVTDVVLELAMMSLPVWLVWGLMMPVNTKFVVIFAFGGRLAMLPIIVLRVVNLTRIRHSSNYTFDLALSMVFAEVEMHFALIAATIPCLRPFLRAFDTGSLATYAAQIEKGMGAPPNSETIAMQSSQRSSNGYNSRPSLFFPKSPGVSYQSGIARHTNDEKAANNLQLPPHLEALEEQPVLDPTASPAITTVRRGDSASISDDESSRHMIRKTVGYDVRYSPEMSR